jgi:hypothetical protein
MPTALKEAQSIYYNLLPRGSYGTSRWADDHRVAVEDSENISGGSASACDAAL